MIDSLHDALPEFPAGSSRVRCFLHVINLVAKTLLSQFETSKDNVVEVAATELGDELEDLAEDVEEDCLHLDDEDDKAEDDNLEGWVEEVDRLSQLDQKTLEKDIRPIHIVLFKVSD